MSVIETEPTAIDEPLPPDIVDRARGLLAQFFAAYHLTMEWKAAETWVHLMACELYRERQRNHSVRIGASRANFT